MKNALAKHLNISAKDISKETYTHHGLSVFSAGGLGEWAVGSDAKATRAARQYIAETLWAFNPDWLCRNANLPLALVPVLKGFCEKECEGANEAVAALVGRKLCQVQNRAISADGRAHFLSPYDGKEEELAAGLVAYRIN